MFTITTFWKRLFPRLSRDQRRREIHFWIIALLAALIVSVAVALVMFVVARPKGFG